MPRADNCDATADRSRTRKHARPLVDGGSFYLSGRSDRYSWVVLSCTFQKQKQTQKQETMAVEIDIEYRGGLRCDAVHVPSGISLHTDAPVDNGGSGASFSPTDLVATALGTCIVTTLALVAQRHDLDLAGTKVHVRKEMVTDPVRRIGGLPTRVTFPPGLSIDDAMRTRLERAAAKCPVHQSLHPDVDASIEFVW